MSDLAFRPQDLGIGRLFERVRDAVIVADATTGRVVLWNPSATEIFGYSVSEALKMNVEELVPERLRERHRAGLARYRETGHGPYIDSHELLELPAMRNTGEEIRIEMSLNPIEPMRGVGGEERRYVLAIVRDITARKRTEEALRESEARFHALVQNALDIVMVTDAQGTLRYISPSVERVLGYRSEEMVGTSTADYVHPDDLQRALGELAEAASTPGVHPVAVETRVRHKDGSWRHLEGIANNLLGDPDVRGMVFNHRDVTDRKRAEEEVRRLNEELENQVRERTARLESALAELRASEERHRLLVDNVEDYAILMVNPDGRVADWNVGAERIFGYREEEIVGEPFSILFTPEDIRSGAPERELRKAEEEGRAVDERWHMRKDGSQFWASGVVTPIRDDAGNLRGFAKVARDITERKRAEEERARLVAIVESSDDAIIAKTLDGIITSWNTGAEKLYGYTAEETVGRPISMLVPPERPDEIPRILESIRRGERVDHFETVRVTKDGRRLDISLTVSPIKNSAGAIVGASTIARDITERKRVEEELIKSESSLSAAQRIAHLGNWDYDIARDEAYWSDELYRIFGFAPQEFVPTYKKFLDLVHPDDKELLRREVRAALYGAHERGHSSVDYRVVRPDGEVRFVSTQYEVVRDASGRPVRLIGTIHDVTERKRVEEALKEVREAERRRIARDLHDGVLQDLSYTAAAMGLIMLDAEDKGPQEQMQRAIDAVRRAAQGLRDAVNDLRLEEEIDRPLPELVQALVQRNQTMARGCEISLEVGEGFPSEPLGESGMQLLRMIQEAFTNARRHSGAKSVLVTLKLEGGDLVAEVSDDGRGFGPESVPGVGLRSMRERAATIGGRVEIKSEVGQGTRVHLRVPIPQRG